jgi:hypothetical protein
MERLYYRRSLQSRGTRTSRTVLSVRQYLGHPAKLFRIIYSIFGRLSQVPVASDNL